MHLFSYHECSCQVDHGDKSNQNLETRKEKIPGQPFLIKRTEKKVKH